MGVLRAIIVVFLWCALFGALGHAQVDATGDFYRGKSINLIVSSSVGGGHDILARAVAKYLPRHIPGNPQILVRNVPGAGGLVAANQLFNVSPRDGLTIGQLQNTLPFEPLFGNKEALYDSTKFLWLGSQAYETAILTVWKTAPVTSIADTRVKEITVGTSGINSMPSFNTRLLVEALGMKLRIIPGYPGQSEVFLAMENGEVDAFPTYYSSLMGARPEWMANGTVKVLVQFGPEREPAMPDVPFAGDIVTDPARKQLLRAATAPQALGRPFVSPPGIPADRLAALRKGFSDTFADPDYLADARKLALTINKPSSGEALQAIIEEVWRMPAVAREQLRKLSGNP